MDGTLRIVAYCECGAKCDAYSEPPDAAQWIHEQFLRLHSGPTHRMCDAATYRKARRRALASKK